MTEQANRKIAIVVSKGGLDEVYPGLILANGARQSDIDVVLFFTFYGLDAVTEKKVDHLHVNAVGNPSSPVPTMVAGLPGMEAVAAKLMGNAMEELDVPPVREMLEILSDSGAKIYGCELAANMYKLTQKDMVEQVEDIITVGDFYDLSEGAQIIFT